jgi:multidrug transporter EmrE-like cation transporter
MKTKKNKKLSPLVLLFIGGIILTVGDVIAARWVHTGGNYLYIFIMLLYMFGMFFLISSYKSEDIAVASVILVIFNVVILTIAGILFFHEGVSITKIVGILLGLIAVVLLELGKKKLLV